MKLPGVPGHQAPPPSPLVPRGAVGTEPPPTLTRCLPAPAVQHLPPAGGPPPAAPAGPEEDQRGAGHPEGPPGGAAAPRARGRPCAQLRGRPEAARPGLGQPPSPPPRGRRHPGPTWSCPRSSPTAWGFPEPRGSWEDGWAPPAGAQGSRRCPSAKPGFCPFSGAQSWGPAGQPPLSPAPPPPPCRGETPTACFRRRTWSPVSWTWSWPAPRPPRPRCSGQPS